MEIHHNEYLAGNIGTTLPKLKLKVDELRRYNWIKIGITTDYQTRAQTHANSKKFNWKAMHILYTTSSHGYIARAESELIRHVHENFLDSTINFIDGGGGINNPENYERFYLYALVQAKRSDILFKQKRDI